MAIETPGLFEDLAEGAALAPRDGAVKAPARVLLPNRLQMELHPSNLESLLAPGHRARIVWGFVERQDLSGMYGAIKAREGSSGRPAIAPEILFALWLYATLEGVGGARALARLTQQHDAYRWICGGVQVNYHTLADFRVDHAEALDALLTDSVASLMAAGVVKLERVAQDGMRVRASAGAASFRCKDKLEQYLEAARKRVETLARQIEEDPGALTRKEQAGQQRAVRERQARIERALEHMPELERIKKKQGKEAHTARASTTDPEATVMKMGDGGFRPAYNVQFGTDTESQVIVGLNVLRSGSDQGQMVPMVNQVEQRCERSPQAWLVDGGYPAHEQIDAVAERTVVYAPVPKPKLKDTDKPKDMSEGEEQEAPPDKPDTDPYAPKPGDSEAVAAWRVRMGTEQAKTIYKDRAASAECVNAQARNRGLIRLPVRGTAKVKCVVLLHALAHNLMRMATLAPQLLGIGTGTSTAGNPRLSSGQFA
ncbi:MAG: IS1182 family transposase [Sterolibacteriaceae bacterium]|uniref:IS1182 family transposase n=1 Tax=Candidatus Methylophosphatis roskildensis TaxID=2899263 RepID=A0A9D7HVS6_9PROT|nr:IS1182 family transposase [Candidatus Methylophosphatis roskildensis]